MHCRQNFRQNRMALMARSLSVSVQPFVGYRLIRDVPPRPTQTGQPHFLSPVRE